MKLPMALKFVHGAVAGTSRNDCTAIYADRESIIDRSHRPMQTLLVRLKRRAEQNKGPNANITFEKESRCPFEIRRATLRAVLESPSKSPDDPESSPCRFVDVWPKAETKRSR